MLLHFHFRALVSMLLVLVILLFPAQLVWSPVTAGDHGRRNIVGCDGLVLGVDAFVHLRVSLPPVVVTAIVPGGADKAHRVIPGNLFRELLEAPADVPGGRTVKGDGEIVRRHDPEEAARGAEATGVGGYWCCLCLCF